MLLKQGRPSKKQLKSFEKANVKFETFRGRLKERKQKKSKAGDGDALADGEGAGAGAGAGNGPEDSDAESEAEAGPSRLPAAASASSNAFPEMNGKGKKRSTSTGATAKAPRRSTIGMAEANGNGMTSIADGPEGLGVPMSRSRGASDAALAAGTKRKRPNNPQRSRTDMDGTMGAVSAGQVLSRAEESSIQPAFANAPPPGADPAFWSGSPHAPLDSAHLPPLHEYHQHQPHVHFQPLASPSVDQSHSISRFLPPPNLPPQHPHFTPPVPGPYRAPPLPLDGPFRARTSLPSSVGPSIPPGAGPPHQHPVPSLAPAHNGISNRLPASLNPSGETHVAVHVNTLLHTPADVYLPPGTTVDELSSTAPVVLQPGAAGGSATKHELFLKLKQAEEAYGYRQQWMDRSGKHFLQGGSQSEHPPHEYSQHEQHSAHPLSSHHVPSVTAAPAHTGTPSLRRMYGSRPASPGRIDSPSAAAAEESSGPSTAVAHRNASSTPNASAQWRPGASSLMATLADAAPSQGSPFMPESTTPYAGGMLDQSGPPLSSGLSSDTISIGSGGAGGADAFADDELEALLREWIGGTGAVEPETAEGLVPPPADALARPKEAPLAAQDAPNVIPTAGKSRRSRRAHDLWKNDDAWIRAPSDRRIIADMYKAMTSGQAVRLRPQASPANFVALHDARRTLSAARLNVDCASFMGAGHAEGQFVITFDEQGHLAARPHHTKNVFATFSEPWTVVGPAERIMEPDWENLDKYGPMEENWWYPPRHEIFEESDFDSLRKRGARLIATPIFLRIFEFFFEVQHNLWPFLVPTEVFEWYNVICAFSRTGFSPWPLVKLRMRMSVLLFLALNVTYVCDGFHVEIGERRVAALASIWEFGQECSRIGWALLVTRRDEPAEDELIVDYLLATRMHAHSVFATRPLPHWLHLLKQFSRYAKVIYVRLQKKPNWKTSADSYHFRRIWGDHWKGMIYHRCWSANPPGIVDPTFPDLRECPLSTEDGAWTDILPPCSYAGRDARRTPARRRRHLARLLYHVRREGALRLDYPRDSRLGPLQEPGAAGRSCTDAEGTGRTICGSNVGGSRPSAVMDLLIDGRLLPQHFNRATDAHLRKGAIWRLGQPVAGRQPTRAVRSLVGPVQLDVVHQPRPRTHLGLSHRHRRHHPTTDRHC